jgi:hypothetical protein
VVGRAALGLHDYSVASCEQLNGFL